MLCKLSPFPGHKQCKKDEFPCRNSRCIAGRFLCNGVNDCGDRSDEDSCQNCTTTGVFSCGKSDICLPAHKLCDGHLDCADGRDEDQKMCGIVKPSSQSSGTCEMSEFQCVDGNCILHAWRCDNSPDCFDGSDEVNCGEWHEHFYTYTFDWKSSKRQKCFFLNEKGLSDVVKVPNQFLKSTILMLSFYWGSNKNIFLQLDSSDPASSAGQDQTIWTPCGAWCEQPLSWNTCLPNLIKLLQTGFCGWLFYGFFSIHISNAMTL